jgi:hypothetical protein
MASIICNYKTNNDNSFYRGSASDISGRESNRLDETLSAVEMMAALAVLAVMAAQAALAVMAALAALAASKMAAIRLSVQGVAAGGGRGDVGMVGRSGGIAGSWSGKASSIFGDPGLSWPFWRW